MELMYQRSCGRHHCYGYQPALLERHYKHTCQDSRWHPVGRCSRSNTPNLWDLLQQATVACVLFLPSVIIKVLTFLLDMILNGSHHHDRREWYPHRPEFLEDLFAELHEHRRQIEQLRVQLLARPVHAARVHCDVANYHAPAHERTSVAETAGSTTPPPPYMYAGNEQPPQSGATDNPTPQPGSELAPNKLDVAISAPPDNAPPAPLTQPSAVPPAPPPPPPPPPPLPVQTNKDTKVTKKAPDTPKRSFQVTMEDLKKVKLKKVKDPAAKENGTGSVHAEDIVSQMVQAVKHKMQKKTKDKASPNRAHTEVLKFKTQLKKTCEKSPGGTPVSKKQPKSAVSSPSRIFRTCKKSADSHAAPPKTPG